MSKRLNLIIGIVIVASLTLAACTPGPTTAPTAESTQPPTTQPTQPPTTQPTQPKVTVNVWFAGVESAVGKEMTAMAATYAQNHPGVEIKYLWETPTEKFIAAVTAGNAPDLYVTYGPQMVGSWAQAGMLAPLDEYLGRGDYDIKDFLPGLLGSTTWRGKVYGVPYGTDMSMLYYNADMFQAAGLDPERPPETIEELLQYAEKLTVVGGGEIKQIGWLPNWGWTHVAGDGSITVRYGATFFDEDGAPGFDDPRWVEVFNFAKWPYDKYGAENVNRFVSGFGEYGTAQDPLCTGKLAMVYDGEWATVNIHRNCPQLNYRIVRFPYPAAYPELKDNFEMGGTTIMMPSNAPQKEDAWKFLAFMLQPENVAMFCFAPTNGNIPSSVRALDLHGQYKDNLPSDFKLFIDLAKVAKPTVIPASHISEEFFAELMKTEELIYNGKIGVEEGLADLQARLMTIYKEKGE